MKNLALVALITMMFSHTPEARAVMSNEKGNGGDVVKCQPTERTGIRSKPHLRVLDSVVLERSRTFSRRKFNSSEQAAASILEKLKSTVPLMAESWESFKTTAAKKVDLERGVVWISGVPKDLADENLYVEVPPGCGKKLVQAILRVGSGPTRFYYDPSIHAEITNDTDELSWLLVHEWLRDYIQDADVIRVLNGYFHSQEFYAASEDQVAQTLESFGLRSHMVGPVASEVRRAQVELAEILSKFEPILADATEKMKRGEVQQLRKIMAEADGWFELMTTIGRIGQPKDVIKRYNDVLKSYSILIRASGRFS